MNLNNSTLAILQNLASINPNLIVERGSILRSVSESKSIIAEVTLDAEFPQDFGIYDLSEFMSAVGLVDDAELSFKEKFVEITNGALTARYFFSDISVLTRAPTSESIAEKVGDPVVSFNLSKETIKKLSQACGVLKMNKIQFKTDDGVVKASVVDTDNPTGNSFSVIVGEYDGEDFEFTVLFSNLKFIHGDYKVEFMNTKMPIGRFTNLDAGMNILYWVAFERK